MNWIATTCIWYLFLLMIGLGFFLLTKRLFYKFYDFGYPFAKTIGILLLSYAVFVLGILKILPFTQTSIFLVLIFFLIITTLILYFFPKKESTFNQPKKITIYVIAIICIEELLFIGALFLLTFIRGQEPSIHGLEKFMDFGFMNSILRSRFFPPLDMWLSADPSMPQGYPINYYYFGHLTGAFLIRLTGIDPAIGYNLILATIFAQSITMVFSLASNIIYTAEKIFIRVKKINFGKLILYGILGSAIVNLSGNLHTIYLFTKGYPNDTPVPFWQILSFFNPTKYWYPNATRFIPFTIHEFPSYSYVVADLHGHVFDIPFVLLTLAILFTFYIHIKTSAQKGIFNKPINDIKALMQLIFNFKFLIFNSVLIGFLVAIHYMTNAFDGPIYLLLALCIYLISYGIHIPFFIAAGITFISFLLFSLPFSINFSPFVSGVGVNCSPSFLTDLKKIGPFIFEKGNCQISPPWMLFVLWGFFWISASILLILWRYMRKNPTSLITNLKPVSIYMLTVFAFGTFLIIIPEFFYIKDIYPAHFRANTMFKLGYQAFIIMGIASVFVIYASEYVGKIQKIIIRTVFSICLFFLFIYPFLAFPSYYGQMKKPVQIDGTQWLKDARPADYEIVLFLNSNISGSPVILEAQGDSYTDYERISANTGLPTVAGWWVHEWLWRGSPDIVGKRIPDVEALYESEDTQTTKELIKKYRIQYIIVSGLEKEKYKKLKEDKFNSIGTKIFTSTNKEGAIYQVN